MNLGSASNQPQIGDVEFLRLDAGDNMVIDVEVGGGLYHSFTTLTGSNSSDDHIGGSMLVPVVVLSFNDASGQTLSSCTITNVTIASGVPTFTCGQALSWVNGAKVQITAVGGISGVNNTGANALFCTAASVAGLSFSCSNINSASGTYTANTGVATKAVLPGPISHSQEIDAIFLDNLLTQNKTTVVRLTNSRSFGSSNNYNEAGTYGAQPHAVVSPDGKTACYNTNFGLPDVNRAVCVPTGYGGAITPPPPPANPSASVSSGVTLSGVVLH